MVALVALCVMQAQADVQPESERPSEKQEPKPEAPSREPATAPTPHETPSPPPTGHQPGTARDARTSESARIEPSSAPAIELARGHFDTAVQHYERGEYERAIAELEAALQLDPSGKDLVYNLSLVHEKLGELDQAIEYLRRYRTMETDPVEVERTEAALRRLEGARRQRRADDPHVPVAVRSRPPPPAPVATAPGLADEWVLGTGAVAVVAAVVGTAFGIHALATRPGEDQATGPGRTADDVREQAERAHASALVADIAFAIGIGAGATSAVLYFGRSRAPEATPQPGGVDEASRDRIQSAGGPDAVDLGLGVEAQF